MSSLNNLDLEDMVSSQFGVDIYDAKAGDNDSVCVLSFRVRGENAARDLSHFLEKEGDWILDSDISTGEDNAGKYLVFVEINRNRRLYDRIQDALEIIERLTGPLKWKFSVGKKLIVRPVKTENLEKYITSSPNDYTAQLQEERRAAMEEFFGAAPFNNVMLVDDQLSLQQFFQENKLHSSVNFTVVSEAPTQEDLAEGQVDPLNNSKSIWLSKVLGPDITVEEIGSNILLTNSKLNKNLLVSLNV